MALLDMPDSVLAHICFHLAASDYGAKTGGFLQSFKRLRAIGRELIVKFRQAEVGAAASPALVINILIFLCVTVSGFGSHLR